MTEPHSTYPISVRWTGERRGLASSADGLPELAVAPPPAFGGPEATWSPEHLFVLAATTCWLTTFLVVAEMSHLPVHAITAGGEGTVERREDRRFHVARIVLRPHVTILREEDRERALRLIEKAENACLIRASVTTAITLEPTVDVAGASAGGGATTREATPEEMPTLTPG